MTKQQSRILDLVRCGLASDEQMEEVGFDAVLATKSDPNGVLLRSYAPEKALGAPNTETRTIPWIFSDETADRMGDIVRAGGIGTTEYVRNPVVLWAHNRSGMGSTDNPPIGTSSNLRVEKGAKAPALMGDVQFAPDGTYELADTVYQLALARVVRAGSIGFRPTKTVRVDDEAKRTALGLGKFGVIFEKSDLLEFSIVPIPANPNALSGVKSLVDAGKVDRAFTERLLTEAMPTERDYRKAIEDICHRCAVHFTDTSAARISDATKAIDDALEGALQSSLSGSLEGTAREPGEELAAGQADGSSPIPGAALSDEQMVAIRAAIAEALPSFFGSAPAPAPEPDASDETAAPEKGLADSIAALIERIDTNTAALQETASAVTKLTNATQSRAGSPPLDTLPHAHTRAVELRAFEELSHDIDGLCDTLTQRVSGA